MRSAEKSFNVPETSLHFRFNNTDRKTALSSDTVLSKEEDILDRCIRELARKGFPRKKEDLQSSVQP